MLEYKLLILLLNINKNKVDINYQSRVKIFLQIRMRYLLLPVSRNIFVTNKRRIKKKKIRLLYNFLYN